MKKIYSLICALAITSIGFAQAEKTFKTELATPKKQPLVNRSVMRAHKSNSQVAKTTAAMSGWFNYGLAAESLFGATSALNSNYLFPDSTGFGEFGAGNFSSIWIHHLAELVNFRSPVFSTDPTTSWVDANGTAPFAIDSMSIYYGYTRNHPDPNIVDTLVVTVYDNQTTTNMTNSGFIGTTAANYGTDTVTFKRIGYNQAGNFICAPTATANPQVAPVGQKRFKILLTIDDTAATVYREKIFAVPGGFNSFGGKLVVGSVMFQPGYTYTIGTHIDYDANAFFFTSLEENGDGGGAGTFPNYFDCNYASAACDYSQSYILPQDVRYNMAGSWNYRFIPSMAYGQTYGFEHHLISFHLTGTTGINEITTQNTFALGQNIPNPFTKESTINYNLVKDASSAIFTVTDVMGRVITTEKVTATAGNHSIKVGSYAAGIYYYSLNVDGNVSTRKMIVE